MNHWGRIVQAFTDTDLYKLTMGQAVFGHYPRIGVEYELINRGKTAFPEGFASALRWQVEQMASLGLTKEEKDFLTRRCGHYLKPTYLEWLSGYRFNPDEVLLAAFTSLGVTPGV